ncbi:hypothetical protein C8F01DRAFT_993555, partial [Mycena amicta]
MGKSVVDYVVVSLSGLENIEHDSFRVQPKTGWSDHCALSFSFRVPERDAPQQDTSTSHFDPVPGPATHLDNLVKIALEASRSAEEETRAYYGPALETTGAPLHIYAASTCVGKGDRAKAACSIYGGPGTGDTSAVPGKQTSTRAALFAITLAIDKSPSNRPLVLYTSSEFAIRTFAYWVGPNYTQGWPCKSADLIRTTAELIRNRAARVEFRFVDEVGGNNHAKAARDLARNAA